MVFKCKMCGGSLEIPVGATVVKCSYCDTQQTLPRLADERRANLYDRAGHFRRNNEFDKAAGIYENILAEDPADAEAYWSLVLCRFGIEYVEDPATKRRLPTVNRAQFTSIFDDENYKAAVAHADDACRALYETEAEAINKIQRGILEISQKEEPFDVFICYKETDRNGRRTHDSVLAQELYYQLKQEGFRVFFSRITLEDKLGSAYEPYIFAALQSSKAMVVLGTHPEHFNAVWVKNEWSRYLSLIKGGAPKVLIPAYRDMDPYDLPEEFSHLQAQDMSKLGFMQDLVRGIKKIVGTVTPKAVPVATPAETVAAVNVSALLRRAALSLEDGDFEKADDFCEQVLNQDPENGRAYFYKLMAELEVESEDRLSEYTAAFEKSGNYQKALRFGDDKLKNKLEGYLLASNTKRENQLLEKAQRIFESIENEIPAEGLRIARDLIEFLQPVQHRAEGAALLRDCRETADRLADRIRREEDEALQWQLNRAMSYVNEMGKPEYALEEAEELLQRLREHADKPYAAEMIPACEAKVAELRVTVEQNRKERITNAAHKRKRILTLFGGVLAVVVLLAILVPLIYNAVTYETVDGVEYIKKDDGYHAYAVVDRIEGDLVIPAEIDGTPVVAIDDNAFYNCTDLTSVTISDGVKSIGHHAFNGCSNLTSVNFGENSQLIHIGSFVFLNCKSLTAIALPANVTSIGDWAFFGCSSLASVIIPDHVTQIGELTFYACSSLSSVTIPNQVTTIGKSAFLECSKLSSITIPDSVANIGICAFYGCSNLTSVSIPDSVTSIDRWAFGGCNNLKTVYYQGSQSDWERISIEDINMDLANATCYYYSENPPTLIGNYWHYDANGNPVIW